MTEPKTGLVILILFAILGSGVRADAQWLNYRAPKAPRTADGKVNLSAPAPRTTDGHPDLSGVWRAEPTPYEELTRLFGDMSATSVPGDDPRTMSKYLFNIFADYKRGEEPMRPEAGKLLGERLQNPGRDMPTTRCLAAGVPLALVIPIPFKIVQTPGLTLMLFEGDNTIRQIYTDGRKHPQDPFPLWLGYSIGSWQGDTFVVDSIGFNDKTWLDGFGHPHSEALHVIERFRRRDYGHIDVEVTVDDPKMYTKPFTVKFTELLQPDTDIVEAFCSENERDRAHLK
jgi:hypothetical protein